MPFVWILGGVAVGWLLGDRYGTSAQHAAACRGQQLNDAIREHERKFGTK